MDISFKHVSYTYQPNGPFEYKALRDLNFRLSQGHMLQLLVILVQGNQH